MTDAPPKKPRGLAAVSPERRREIAAMGGRAGKGNPNRPWAVDRSRAVEAGRKGGLTRGSDKPTQ